MKFLLRAMAAPPPEYTTRANPSCSSIAVMINLNRTIRKGARRKNVAPGAAVKTVELRPPQAPIPGEGCGRPRPVKSMTAATALDKPGGVTMRLGLDLAITQSRIFQNN